MNKINEKKEDWRYGLDGSRFILDRRNDEVSIRYYSEYWKEIRCSTSNRRKAEVAFVLACLYCRANRYTEAFKFLYQAFLFGNNTEEYHKILCSLLANPTTKIRKSIEEKISKTNSSFASFAILSAIAYLKKNPAEMRQNLKKAIKIRSEDAYLTYYLGKCFKLEGNYGRALEEFEKFNKIRADLLHFTYYERFLCYKGLMFDCWRQGKFEDSKNCLTEAIVLTRGLKNKLGLQFNPFLDILENDLLFLEKIIIFDEQFQKVFEVRNLVDLFEHLSMLTEESKPIMRTFKNDSRVDSLHSRVFFAKLFCLRCIFRAFAPYKKTSQWRLLLTGLGRARRILLKLGFIEAKQAIDAVESFVTAIKEEVRKGTYSEMILEKEQDLIKLLRPAYVLGRQLSQYMAEFELQERRFESLKETVKDQADRVINTNAETVEAILKVLLPRFPRKTGELILPKEVEINFFKDNPHIKIDGKEMPIMDKQYSLLLEEIVNRKIIHWSIGFKIFDEWHDKEKNIKNPVSQFKMRIWRFNDSVGYLLIDSYPTGKKRKKRPKELWTFTLPLKVIKTTIRDSDDYCEKAKVEQDKEKSVEFINKAFDSYPNSLEAIKLFIDFILVNQKEELINGLPSKLAVLKQKKINLDGAIKKVEENGRDKRWPGYWNGAIEHYYRMRSELAQVEACLNTAEKLWDKKELSPSDRELNEICEEWVTLERLAKSKSKKEEDRYYNELFNHHLERPVIKEVLDKISSKVNFKIREELKFKKFESEDIAQEVKIFYLTLIKNLYFSKRNFKNIKELKGSLIKGLSLKIRDEIIKGKNRDIFTETNLKKIREVWKIKRELRQKLERKPRDEEVLKKLGPQWNIEKLKEIQGFINELYQGERDIDIEKYIEFYEEGKAYEKTYREGLEESFNI